MPGLSYSLVSRTGLARTVAAIDGRPEVTVPTACTNGHTVDPEVTIYVRTGRRLQTSTDALRPAGRSQGERTDENALTWPNRARDAAPSGGGNHAPINTYAPPGHTAFVCPTERKTYGHARRLRSHGTNLVFVVP
jgi:hypothetical protein